MAINALSRLAIQDRINRTEAEKNDEYSLYQLIGIWALVGIPHSAAWSVNHSHHSFNP